MRRGAVRKEVLVFGAALIAAIGTTLYLWGRISEKSGVKDEAARMRKLYVGLSLYESDADGNLPPDLPRIGYLIASSKLFTSAYDPYQGEAAPFPIDGSLPDSPRESQTRISDAYLYAHAAAGRIQAPAWPEAKFDTSLGLLSNEWVGEVSPQGAFRADVSGRLLRVNTDGSLAWVQREGPKPLGDAQDLFRRPPEGHP